jgi:hypothetical protein
MEEAVDGHVSREDAKVQEGPDKVASSYHLIKRILEEVDSREVKWLNVLIHN